MKFNDFYRPPINTMLRNFWHSRIRHTQFPLTAESLMAAAENMTKLAHWPEGHGHESLEILLSSFNNEASLSYYGKRWLYNDTLLALSNQLYNQNYMNNNPDINMVKISKPIIIIGLPRSGTTFLHNLIAQNNTMQVPNFWKLIAPVQSTDIKNKSQTIHRAEYALKQFYSLQPKMRAIHETSVRGPEECFVLFRNARMDPFFSITGNIPSYINWFLNTNLDASYQYYHQQLQIIQGRNNEQPWVLKSVMHLLGLDSLLKVFPDARIVFLHRNPKKALTSWCSLAAMMQRVMTEKVDMALIGQVQMNLFAEAIKRTQLVQKSLKKEQVYHVNYDDLMSDPVFITRDIFQHFNVDIDSSFENKANAWLGDNQQFKHGKHPYSIKDFSLDEEEIASRLNWS